MRHHVIYRENSTLDTQCDYHHLTPAEGIALLRHRLEHRQDTRACRSCATRLGDEAAAQIHSRRPS